MPIIIRFAGVEPDDHLPDLLGEEEAHLFLRHYREDDLDLSDLAQSRRCKRLPVWPLAIACAGLIAALAMWAMR